MYKICLTGVGQFNILFNLLYILLIYVATFFNTAEMTKQNSENRGS